MCSIAMNISKIRYKNQFRNISLSVLLSLIPAVAAGSGVRIALLGDSMTWIGGDSCGNAIGWSHQLKQTGIADAIDVYARSGATWTNTCSTRCDTAFYSEVLHDDNVIYNQARRLIGRVSAGVSVVPDLIIVFAGANDAWFADKRPGIYDSIPDLPEYTLSTKPSDVTSLQGSVALVCDILTQSLPESKIMLVAPLEMSKVPASVTHKVSDIIAGVAAPKGITTLRADRDVDIRHDVEADTPVFTSDGVHTNEAGASLLATYIIRNIENSIKNIQK